MSRVLFVSAEAAPLIKVGGLADVVGSLPSALVAAGVEARILIPKYGLIADQLPGLRVVASGSVPWQGRDEPVTIVEAVLPGTATPLYLLDAPSFFADGGVYYEHDQEHGARLAMQRFTFFPWAAAHLIHLLPWQPETLHCHDWHTATLPLFLELVGRPMPTVLTIHNIEGQGRWQPDEISSWLGVASTASPLLGLRDSAGDFNALQVGIHGATALNTVSPTYAQELLRTEFGGGLERDLATRPGGVVGILNGIDQQRFDPNSDAALTTTYAVATVTAGKASNKHHLLQELGLADGPLFGLVGRLTTQKGIDLVIDAAPDLVAAGGRLVMLGSGVPDIERQAESVAARYPDHVRVVVKFDAALAQRIYAAADFFLMPSRFEPCGLGQLIAMRYGTLPIVRDTGGLHDTVRDLAQSDGTGFVFGPPTHEALRGALDRALQVFAQPDMMHAARIRAMAEDFSWERAARQYANLYAQSEK